MAEHKLTVDGSTPWSRVHADDVHISADGDFGGGTIAVEKRRGGVPVPVYDDTTAVEKTVDFDALFYFMEGEVIRVTLTGATSPDLIVGINSKNIESPVA